MKTKIKRHSRAVLSIVLTLCMLVSCIAVGIIATNAAYIDGKLTPGAANAADIPGGGASGEKGSKDDGDALGAAADDDEVGVSGTVYIRGAFASNWSSSGVAMSQKDGNYFYSASSLANGSEFKFKNNNKEYGKSSSENGRGQRNISSFGSSSSNYNTVEEGQNTFFWTGSTGAVTIWVNGDLTRTWVTSGTTAATSYAISYNSPDNGSFTTKPTTGTEGSTITVVATPNTGYQINTVSVYKTGASSTTVLYSRNGNTITFTMPDYDVTVNVTFSICSYAITASTSHCTVTGFSTSATYNSTVNFTVAPDTDYTIKTVTVKQGTTNVPTTKDGNTYTFTMPAGAVTITATCTTTVGLVSFYFKSATAWVYHPFISVNGGPEVEMTLGASPDYLDQGTTTKKVKPYSQTGSLRYAWYKVDITGIDTSKPVTITVRGQDTYMEATGTFTLEAGTEVYLACDNLMEGSELVNLSTATAAVKDFYESPLHMVANATEIAQINET